MRTGPRSKVQCRKISAMNSDHPQCFVRYAHTAWYICGFLGNQKTVAASRVHIVASSVSSPSRSGPDNKRKCQPDDNFIDGGAGTKRRDVCGSRIHWKWTIVIFSVNSAMFFHVNKNFGNSGNPTVKGMILVLTRSELCR